MNREKTNTDNVISCDHTELEIIKGRIDDMMKRIQWLDDIVYRLISAAEEDKVNSEEGQAIHCK